MIYTVTFNPALDYVMKVEKLRFDDIKSHLRRGAQLRRKGNQRFCFAFKAGKGKRGTWLQGRLHGRKA